MRRLLIILLLAALIVSIPIHGLSEDRSTVQLARVLYTIARDESYEAKVALASVIMNRVDNPWYGNTLSDVLNEKQQFPAGSSYDDESLRAAHAVITGTRTVDPQYVNWSTTPVDGSVYYDGLYVFTRT